MQIRLQTMYAGPRGAWQAGSVMTVGLDCSLEEAQALIIGKYAQVIADAPAPAGVMETADAAPPETAMVARRRRATGRP